MGSNNLKIGCYKFCVQTKFKKLKISHDLENTNIFFREKKLYNTIFDGKICNFQYYL